MRTSKHHFAVLVAIAFGLSALLTSSLATDHRRRASWQSPNSKSSSAVSIVTQVGAPRSKSTAMVYYVSPSGSDSGPGNKARPFRTLYRAVKPLRPGDKLYLRQGTYPEALLDVIPGGTAWSAPVTIAAYPKETAILRPGREAGWVLRFSRAASKYIVISGLILDASNVAHDAVKITDDWNGSGGSAASHIRLLNCEIKNVRPGAHMGVLITANLPAHLFSDGNELLGCKIHEIGGSSGRGDHQEGVYIQSNNNIVDGCEIYNVSSYGVQIYSGSLRADGSVCSRNTIRNCKIYHTDLGTDSGSLGILIGVGKENTALNNLIWGNRGGIKVHHGATKTRLFNNTICKNGKAPGIFIGTAVGTIVQNNLLYLNREGIRDTGTGTTADHNSANNADPLFVHPDGTPPDLHLRPGSLAIGGGVVLSEVTTDLGGMRRPKGRGHDLGAFVYRSP